MTNADITNTGQKTYKKKVIAKACELMPTAVKAVKLHVAGIGYAYYFKNAAGLTIGNTCKGSSGWDVRVK